MRYVVLARRNMTTTDTVKRKRGRPRQNAGDRKTTSKNLRIRGRVRFAIEFWAAWEGKSDTSLIEAAIEHYADTLSKTHNVKWRPHYHSHLGVRWFAMYLLDGFPFTDDHDARRDFVQKHRAFFYVRSGDHFDVNALAVEALCGPMDGDAPWAQFDALRKPGRDVWAPGKAIAAALKSHGFEPPTWPPKGVA